MYNFFNTQMDYIYFLYGLAFILLGTACFSGKRDRNTIVPWVWLGVFALVHGTMEWMELLSITLYDSPKFSILRSVVMAVSFAFLAEFGRSAMRRITSRGPGIYFVPVLLAASFLGVFAGLPAFNVISRYTMALGGGMLAAVSLFIIRQQGQSREARCCLTVVSSALAVYALASGLIVPRAMFFPASLINVETFFQLTGIPIQLVRALLAVILSVAVAIIKSKSSAANDEEKPFAEIRTKYTQRAALLLLIVISLGWILTQATSNSRISVILHILTLSVLIILLAIAWSRNQQATLRIAQLQIDGYKKELDHKAAEALRESEERYRTLFEKNANPILVIDMTGDYIAGNQAALDFLEVSRAKLLNMNVLDTVPPGFEQIIDEHKPMWEKGGVVETPYYVNDRIKTLEMTINPVILSGRQVCFAMGKDVTNRKAAEQKIKFMAYHDALTNLPNRALFKDKLKLAIENASREGNMFAVLFLDLDRFKLINDTLGHNAGDEFLQVTAGRLMNCIREEDTVSRQGGDEFTILLSRIKKPQDAIAAAKKILKEVQKPVVLSSRKFQISASVGITMYPGDGEDIDTLLRNADITMYRSKASGGNIYRLYTPSMNVETMDRMELENSLRTALQRQEFELYYQPQVNLKSGRIVGMEALLRWHHPSLGLLPPMEFIPIAEETGLIISMGDWVLHTACSQAKAWQDAGYPDIRVAVNISARQFRQTDLPRRIAKFLHETKLDPKYLELEITETTVMQNLDYSIKIIGQLKNMGIRISLDDFGIGYSSLSYLKRFPSIDALKIDRSFVEDIALDAEDKSSALVSTMVILAQKLNLQVVAEGVETEEQLEFLRQHRCDEIQGFLFSKPLPVQEFEKLLNQHCHLAVS